MSHTELSPLDPELLLADLFGAEDDEDGDEDESEGGADGSEPQDDDKPDADGLTSGGRKAIEAERAAAKKARDAARPWLAIKREFGLDVEQVRERLKSTPKTAESDLEDARREAAIEATRKANTRILRAEVKGLAAEAFVDPADALLYIDLDDFEVDEDGDVDSAAIKRALADVLKRKPHLGKTAKKTGADFDGGARQSAPKKEGMNGLIRTAAGIRR